LQEQGYEKYVKDAANSGGVITIKDWKSEMSKKSPQFLYWSHVLDLELSCLQLVRALREANFALYVESLMQIAPWYLPLITSIMLGGCQFTSGICVSYRLSIL